MRYISSFVILVACHMARTIRINMIGSRDHRSWTLSSFKLVSRIVRGPTQAGIIPPMSENSSTAVLVSLIQLIQVTVPQGATRISSLSQHFLFTGFLTYRGETGLRSTCANFDRLRQGRSQHYLPYLCQPTGSPSVKESGLSVDSDSTLPYFG